jgi:hypothetical protein
MPLSSGLCDRLRWPPFSASMPNFAYYNRQLMILQEKHLTRRQSLDSIVRRFGRTLSQASRHEEEHSAIIRRARLARYPEREPPAKLGVLSLSSLLAHHLLPYCWRGDMPKGGLSLAFLYHL